MWQLQSCPEPEDGSQSHGDPWRPEAALSREAGVGATGKRGGPGAALPFVLIWNLYAGVPGPQGTDSGPRAHLERGCEPTGGANSLTPRLVTLNFLLGSLKRAP
jgi:hypothetical protein